MTGPGAARAAPGPGRGSRSPRGENRALAHHEAHRSLGARAPPAVPGALVPPLPTTGAPATQSAFALSSPALLLEGRASGSRRGGVVISGLRSPTRGESATGLEGKLKSRVPASARLLSLSLFSLPEIQNLHSPSRLAGSGPEELARRLRPERKQLFPETSPPSTLPTGPHAL